MDVRKIITVAALLISSSSFCYAGHTGKIRFIGTVVESGCWNAPGKNDMFCYRDRAITHYDISQASKTSLDVSNAVVEKTFLDKEKKLELLRVEYY